MPRRRATPARRVASQRLAAPATSQQSASQRVLLGLAASAPTSRRVAIPIEDPGGRGLAPFFHALSELEHGRIRRLRISHWGDSHVAGSVLTGRLRDRLQQRYGDAGPGFVLLGRPWPTYRQAAAKQGVHRRRRWRSERLWTHYSRRHRRPRDDLFGLPGISVYTRQRARTWVEPRRGRVDGFDLYYLRQPGGGRVDILVDGRLQRRVFTLSSRQGPGFARVELGRPARRIEFRTAGGEVRLYGVDLWRKKAGIVYDAFGINGARADAHLKWNEAFFAAQLQRLSPQLIVVAYGSNEVDADRVVAARWQVLFDQVVQRLRKALPSAACLVLGPPDQARRARHQPFQLTDRLSQIIAAQRRVALRRGCAFWDQRQAMGGPGSIFRWVAADPPLARRDHVHLYGSGYRLLGDALFKALQEAQAAAGGPRKTSKPAK